METRLKSLKKRKAEECIENIGLQKQMFDNCNQPDNGIGPRDIVIGDDQILNANNMEFNVKQEVKMETEVENEFEIVPSEIEFKPSRIKVEVKREKVVVVTEAELICDDVNKTANTSNDANLDIRDSFNRLEHSEDLQIVTKSDLSPTEDVTHQNMDKVLETEKEHKIAIDDSDTYIDPIYEARLVMETQHLEKILPRKVWIQVSDALEDSDFLNYLNSSPFCRSLLSNARIFSLYKPVLVEIVTNLSGLSGFEKATEYKAVLLLSRTVCKKWKTIVDAAVENWFVRNNLRSSQTSQTLLSCLSSKYLFKDFSGQVEKFIEMFKATHCSSTDNPFFGRYINITTIIQCTWPPFETNLSPFTKLLDAYGCHVLSCEINILTIQFQSPNHQTIFHWLREMPNLSSLKICYPYFTPFQDQFVDDDFLPPNLKNLKILNLDNAPPKCFHKILKANRNISSLTVQRSCAYALDPKYLAPLKYLNNLKELLIYVESRHDQKYVYKLNSPLKILAIFYRIPEDWAKNLEKISKFSQSLETLMLFNLSSNISMNANLLRYSYHGRLYLPKLKMITLEVSNFICLDFLLPAKLSLEEIHFIIHRVDLCGEKKQYVLAIEKKQIIQFFGYEGKLLDSNIWRLFPNLKNVCLNLTNLKIKYTRREWMNHVKMLDRQFST